MKLADAALLGRLARLAADQPEDSRLREVARVTGALPVYMDLGGALAITDTSEVLSYQFETREVAVEDDRRWRRIAYCHAARAHPELSVLLPVRPDGAASCPQCSGEYLNCGTCWGTGWIDYVLT